MREREGGREGEREGGRERGMKGAQTSPISKLTQSEQRQQALANQAGNRV